MKHLRILAAVCLVLALVLWTGSASGASCQHLHLKITDTTFSYENVSAGHVLVITHTGECDDCGGPGIRISEGPLLGHEFNMAESLHFNEDNLHVWAFICVQCHGVFQRELPCGGDRCYTYHCDGRDPAVQYLDSYAVWQADHPEEVIAALWLAAKEAE